jgi:site-specific DNA-cytosine methylase
MKLNIVEIFSGSGTFSSECKKRGHNTFSVDFRRRKGVCEPDLKKNVIDLTPADIPLRPVHILWMSFPCTTFTNAAGAFHYKGQLALTDISVAHIELFRKSIKLIEELKPVYFFIENPTGKLRYFKLMTDFLAKNGGMIKQITMSSYGFPTTKPTDVFTNALDIQFLPMDPYGRGAKCERTIQDNFTTCQRQKTPALLAQAIIEYAETHITE